MSMGAARIRALLDEHGITPSRALGQNFLVDPNTARRIATASGASADDAVLEIGPGLGSLTVELAALGATVTAVELDRYLVPVLRSVVSEEGLDAEIVEADALEVDFAAVLSRRASWRLAANLPYNVGTSIFLRVLEEAPAVTGGVVLVQTEVAERLTAAPGSKAYGIPSVKATWWAHLRVGGKVGANVFHPRPRVGSAFVTFERRPPPGDDELRRRVFDLVDAGFGQRRKMLRRALGGRCSAADFERAGIDGTRRAESLDLDEWVRLAR